MKSLIRFTLLALATNMIACVGDDTQGQPPPGNDSGVAPLSDSGGDATLADAGGAGDAAGAEDAGDGAASPVDAAPQDAAACSDAGTGRCLVVLATNQGNPEGLVLHGGYLYWIEEGLPQHIHRILLAGGTPEDLGGAGVASSTLAVDDTTMYWNDQYGGAIYSAPNTGIPDGGALTPLGAVKAGEITGMLVDTSGVYWTDYNAGNIYTVPLTGGTPTVVASPGGTPDGIATDGVNLYWANTTGRAIQSIPLGGDAGAVVNLATGVSAPTQVVVAEGTIYFASASANDIYSFPTTGMTDGGTPPVFVATGPDTTSSFVFDGTNVYWTTNANPGGELQSAPPGGAATALALGLTEPGSLTFDTTNVYWADFAFGAVFLMAKP